MITRDAKTIWNSLKGIICVYKPAETKVTHVRKTIINNLCTGLNDLDVRPPIGYVNILGDPSKQLKVTVQPNLADDILVVGPRYQCNDVLCSWSNYLGKNTSGVLLLGIRDGRNAKRIRENRPTRAYRVKGKLGEATDNFFKDGKIIERTTFRHVKPYHIEKLLANIQTSHQKKMFELCGVDMQSQTAYEMAIKGPLRPVHSKIPIIYGIKCVHFENQEFTLEIQCVNEYEKYLQTLIHEIGMKLHSSAHCTGIQCIRHSYFTLDDCLLRKHWNLQHIITNIEKCRTIIDNNENILYQKSIALQ